ncbi:MAG: hypothetical protein ABSF62_04995, partial [Bryobacteraceae bacterium]
AMVLFNSPDLLMNSTAPLLNFAVTRRGMSGLGRLLSIPTARSGMPTVLEAAVFAAINCESALGFAEP